MGFEGLAADSSFFLPLLFSDGDSHKLPAASLTFRRRDGKVFAPSCIMSTFLLEIPTSSYDGGFSPLNDGVCCAGPFVPFSALALFLKVAFLTRQTILDFFPR